MKKLKHLFRKFHNKNQGLTLVEMIVTFMLIGLFMIAAAGVKNVSLCDFDTIAKVAAEENYIRPQDVQRLIAFRNNPSDESWINK